MTKYAVGANFEREVKKFFESNGWFMVRSAGSHSPVDLVAIKKTEGYKEPKVIFIQCKTTGRVSQKEFDILQRLALDCNVEWWIMTRKRLNELYKDTKEMI